MLTKDSLVLLLSDPIGGRRAIYHKTSDREISEDIFYARKHTLDMRTNKLLLTLQGSYWADLSGFTSTLPASSTPSKLLLRLLKWSYQPTTLGDLRFRASLYKYIVELRTCIDELRKNESLVAYSINYCDVDYNL